MKQKLQPIWWLNRIVEKNYIPRMSLSAKSREKLIAYNFKRMNGRALDYENPKRFSDKIVWYMTFYENKDFARMLCKVDFKEYIKEKIGDGHTAKLYGSWERVEDIDWDSLPDSFVLKSNCSSFGNNIIFVENKNDIDFEKLKQKLKPWLDFRTSAINSFARGYYHIKPKIFAEEIIGDAKAQPVDYKLFCFNGVPTYAYSAFEHFCDGKPQSSKIAIYDMNWNVLPVKYKKSENMPVEKPKHFDEMVKAAEILSKDIPFVRIDFYDTDKTFYLGEMTFYSGGLSNSFTPDSFDFEMGEKFILPPKQRQPRMKCKL